MIYRDYGKSGDRVSILGMGGGRLPETEINGNMYPDQDEIDRMARAAYAGGVNYFDTAPLYCSGNCEAAVGHAVKDFRNRIYIAGKLRGEDARANRYFPALEQTLRNLGTDYLDYYYFWGIGKGFFDEVICGQGLLEQAYRAKEQGLIRHVSFSFHGVAEEIRHIIDKAEQLGYPFESVLVQYNFLDRSNEEMLAYAVSRGLGTTVMGPVGGGRLAAPLEFAQETKSALSMPSYELAMRFVLENPNVCCALSGVQNTKMVEENVTIPDRCSFDGEGAQPVRSLEAIRKFSELYCTGCKYCQPCPAGIRIPDIFQFYTYYHVYGLETHAKNQFRDYRARGRKTSADCLDCGQCEEKCPQKLKIRSELKRVERCLSQDGPSGESRTLQQAAGHGGSARCPQT